VFDDARHVTLLVSIRHGRKCLGTPLSSCHDIFRQFFNVLHIYNEKIHNRYDQVAVPEKRPTMRPPACRLRFGSSGQIMHAIATDSVVVDLGLEQFILIANLVVLPEGYEGGP